MMITALKQEPKNDKALLKLVHSYVQLNMLEQAIVTLKAAIPLRPNDRSVPALLEKIQSYQRDKKEKKK